MSGHCFFKVSLCLRKSSYFFMSHAQSLNRSSFFWTPRPQNNIIFTVDCRCVGFGFVIILLSSDSWNGCLDSRGGNSMTWFKCWHHSVYTLRDQPLWPGKNGCVAQTCWLALYKLYTAKDDTFFFLRWQPHRIKSHMLRPSTMIF